MKAINSTTTNRKPLPITILQFGEGNFLRGFADWMIDKINSDGLTAHGVAVVQPIEQGISDLLNQQDGLYHVTLQGIKNGQPVKENRLISCIQTALNPYKEYNAYENLILSPDLKLILSNTTEAGIRYDDQDDLSACPPKTFPAKVTALLYKRFKKFGGNANSGLSIICCELIEDNGSTLRSYVLAHAKRENLGASFIQWITNCCYFYDTLVDRIVPGFPSDSIHEIKEELGYDDNLVVKGEYFHLWAIAGDPQIKELLPFHRAGLNVVFTDNIHPIRTRKVRILNGSHTAMASLALQLNCLSVREAISHPLIRSYIRKMVFGEIIPVIPENQEQLCDYASQILERFYNPYINHYLKDIALNSLSKWETRNYPTVKDYYDKYKKIAPLSAFSLASLLVLYSGKSRISFQPNDAADAVHFIRSTFNPDTPGLWIKNILENRSVWSNDFTSIPGFIEQVGTTAANILTHGPEQELYRIIE